MRSAAARLQHALAFEGIPAVFSLQPELILSPKPLTAVEAKFADHTRQISRRYITYMYQELQPAISRLMAESCQRNGSVFRRPGRHVQGCQGKDVYRLLSPDAARKRFDRGTAYTRRWHLV